MSLASDVGRLEVLQSTQLLDSEPEPAFDRLTRLAANLLGAPTALVSLVDAHRQFFKSAFGLNEQLTRDRETPLSHSFCKYVARDRAPLVVGDARQHPVLRDNPAIRDHSVIAYAGIPLVVEDQAIGAFCVIDDKPREWRQEKIQILQDLADSVVSEIRLRMALQSERDAQALTAAIVESMGDACIAIDPSRKFVLVNPAASRLLAGAEVGKTVPDGWSTMHRSKRPDGAPMKSEDGALGRGLRGMDTNGLTFTVQRPGTTDPIWVEVSGRPVRDRRQQVVGSVAVYRDITEKKRQIDFYAALAQHIPRGMVGLFDRDLLCLAIDGGLVRASGVAPQKLVGRTVRKIAGLGRDDAAFDRIEEMFRQTLGGQTLSTDFENGGRMLSLTTAPVRDALGEITAGIVLAMDVTHERQLEAQLRRSEQIHRAIVQHLPNGAIFVVDRDLRYVSAEGPLIPEILRRTDLDGVVGLYAADLASPANRDALLAQYRRALAGERSSSEIERDGRFFEVTVVPIADGREITHALITSYDVTDRRREAIELREARDSYALEQALLDTALENIEDGVALIDSQSRILVANRAFAAMLGMPVAKVIGLTRKDFVAHVGPLLAEPEGFAEALDAQPPNVAQEFTFARPRRRVLTRTWTRVPAAGGDAILVTWHDVTAERDLLREREQLLLIDALTGIPNRRAAENALRTEHERMKRMGTPLCVALFDVDHFKSVNDLYGHAAGDEVLRIVAASLARAARLTDTVARWGGEEFVAVLNGPLDGARVFCERARDVIEKLICPGVGRVTISGGVAEVGPSETVNDALARADQRLYDAKRGGRNRVRG
jgi:diguanylate cyclase (GGDEF)-like protein/PAS domain S-box-containing protein